MSRISEEIRIFNEAFKAAWELAVHDQKITPDLGPRLSENIRVLIKSGATDASVIGEEAYRSIARR